VKTVNVPRIAALIAFQHASARRSSWHDSLSVNQCRQGLETTVLGAYNSAKASWFFIGYFRHASQKIKPLLNF